MCLVFMKYRHTQRSMDSIHLLEWRHRKDGKRFPFDLVILLAKAQRCSRHVASDMLSFMITRGSRDFAQPWSAQRMDNSEEIGLWYRPTKYMLF